jgi:hypothetical protein
MRYAFKWYKFIDNSDNEMLIMASKSYF